MKIIIPGVLPEKSIWRGECSNCKQVMEAEQYELRIHSSQKEGNCGTSECSLCRVTVYFYPKNEK